MFTTPSVTNPSDLPPELASPRSGRKRKQLSYADDDNELDDTTYDDNAPLKKAKTIDGIAPNATLDEKPKKSPKKKGNGKPKDEEKRLRRFRAHPPQSYFEIKARALTQRLTVISRERIGTDEVPEERVVMAGSTGNVYTQHICHIPQCDCPHAKNGNQCKHIIYVMLRVLKAPENIGYQLALTGSELRDVFKNAAPIPGADPNAGGTTTTEDGNRKPIEGECPICYTEFEADKEAIAYCKSGCGNNVHKDCMQSWMTAKAGKATCPYCRAEWEDEHLGGFGGKVDMSGVARNEDGYLNIASQLGLSGEKDWSSYHQPWVRQRFGSGRGYRY